MQSLRRQDINEKDHKHVVFGGSALVTGLLQFEFPLYIKIEQDVCNRTENKKHEQHFDKTGVVP